MPSKSIDSVVGEKLSEFRKQSGYSYTQIADAARQFGARWGSSGVRAIERGEAALTLDKLLILAMAIRSLTGEGLSLQDLLMAETEYAIGDNQQPIEVPPGWLLEVLRGGEIVPPVKLSAQEFNPETRTFMQHVIRAGDTPPDPQEGFLRLVATSAERRVAKKLGINDDGVSAIAHLLWGHSLDIEARERAGENASPQARGRVTRTLTNEIQAYVRNSVASNSEAQGG